MAVIEIVQTEPQKVTLQKKFKTQYFSKNMDNYLKWCCYVGPNTSAVDWLLLQGCLSGLRIYASHPKQSDTVNKSIVFQFGLVF